MTVLDDLLAKSGFALIDGATGTELFKRGLGSGDPPEAWNADEPDKIRSAYKAYVDAGSDLFLTNSFGGTHYRLALHKLDDRVVELNERAARLGREVADQAMAETPGRLVLVAGSMGPTGELLEPMGSMTPEGCAAAFAEQATGLAAGGADILWIETMSSLEEVEAAVQGAREACETIMGSSDYLEQYFAINVVFEPMVAELVRSGFVMQCAAAHNDFVTPSVVSSAETDYEHNLANAVELFHILAHDETHGAENCQTLRDWHDKHMTLAVGAANDLQPIWSQTRVKSASFTDAFERAQSRAAEIKIEIGFG